MPYCGTQDIQQILPKITFGTATTITIADLTEIINERSQWIDDSIRHLYIVPVGTANYGTMTLKIINQYSATHDTLIRLIAIGQSESSPVAESLLAMSEDMLEKIKTGQIILMGTAAGLVAERTKVYDSGLNLTGTTDAEGDERKAVFSIEDKY